MNYTKDFENNQYEFDLNDEYLYIPSNLTGFVNTDTEIGQTKKGRIIYILNGYMLLNEKEAICDRCHKRAHINNIKTVDIKHLTFGNYLTVVRVKRYKFYCYPCHHSFMQEIPFKDSKHLITIELREDIEKKLSTSHYNLKNVSELTGVGKNIVKDIDKTRLIKKYYNEDGTLKPPLTYARFIAIDEFSLHVGRIFATHIINLETGEVLWIEEGKKKKVVYDFINHVGLEWMKHVEAVGCDMNSDFEEAFREKCPHITIVFDYFHISKHLNDEVINNIKKTTSTELIKNKEYEKANMLKKSKYILYSSKETLENGKEYNLNKYNQIINENIIFFTIDMIKEYLKLAYKTKDKDEMEKYVLDMLEICELSDNYYLLRFRDFILNHLYGIVTHAEYFISSGKMEGFNNKVETIKRLAYGFNDDEYFFLKVRDAGSSSNYEESQIPPEK